MYLARGYTTMRHDSMRGSARSLQFSEQVEANNIYYMMANALVNNLRSIISYDTMVHAPFKQLTQLQRKGDNIT